MAGHARQVESLEVDSRDTLGFDQHLRLLLPWPKLSALQSIKLSSVWLFRTSFDNNDDDDSSSSNATPLLPCLKELHISSCRLYTAKCLACLASSTALTSLVVKGQAFGYARHDREQLRFSEPLAALLQQRQQQPQLQQLRLTCFSLSHEVVKHVVAIRGLQDLEFEMSQLRDCGEWSAQLPSSLTRLRLRVVGPTIRTPLQLQHLSSLSELQLSSCTIDPATLAGKTQLTALELRCCALLPCHDDDVDQAATVDATAALLQAVQQLTQL